MAMPEALVATVIVAVELPKIPEAPAPGAAKVTFTPETGLFSESRTVTARAAPNAAPALARCGVVPALAVMVDAAPVVLVRAKLTEVTPDVEAVTL